jgi:hypothetical protein
MAIENDEELEQFIIERNDIVESVTTCVAEHKGGCFEHGIVITVSGKDIVLLKSELEEIVSYLGDDNYVGSND